MADSDRIFSDPGIDRSLANVAKKIAERNVRTMDPEPVKQENDLKEVQKDDIKETNIPEFKKLIDPPPNNNKFLILDIETAARTLPQEFEDYLVRRKVKHLVKKDIIEKNIEEFKNSYALSPETGRVILAGMIDQSKNIHQFGLEETPMAERIIIERTFEIITDNYENGGALVTFNGKGFDLPFLISRALQLNCDIDGKIPKSLLGKYAKAHIDLYDMFETSLAKLSYLMGLDENFESEGGLIPGWYANKEYQKIRLKNETDLYNTLGIYKRVERLINVWA